MSLAPLAQSGAAETLAQAQRVLWPHYECHKVVAAGIIVDIVHNFAMVGDTTLMVAPYDDIRAVEPFWPSEPAMAARAEIGGYAVIYEDGYRSVSPKAAFEAGYTPIRKPETGTTS